MELAVYNINGEKLSRTVTLDDAVFSIEPNDHAIYLDTKQYLANQRQGTHKTKEKWEVARTTKKLKRQKGTGGARAGSLKSPLAKGGGRVFGPQPRDYDFKLNKKLKKLARKSAISYKLKEEKLTILEDFTFETPKTKVYVDMLQKFELTNKRTLLVVDKVDEKVVLSARNLQNAKVMMATDLNTFDILKAHHLLVTEGSVKEFEKINA